MALGNRLLLAFALLACGAAAPDTGPVCIQNNMVDHTEIPNDSTILFHMRDGSVYRNDLPSRCVGLKNASGGFTYEPTDPGTDELCGDLGMFHVNERAGFGYSGGQVCNFGAFTQIAGVRGSPIHK